MLLSTPLSIIGVYISFSTIKNIGPKIIPLTPIILYPVNIDIRVNTG